MPQHISIIAPFFNEESGAREFYQRLLGILEEQSNYTFDFIFVDDASQDDTLRILKDIASTSDRVTVLSLGRNFGHQAALTAGLDVARGDVVITMDSDLQHPPDLIPRLLAEYEAGSDIVYAVRRMSEKVSVLKRGASNLFYILINRITDLHIQPGAADFRLMSKPVVEILKDMRETHRFLRGMVPWIGFNSSFVEYDQPERFAGQPAYTWRKSLQLAVTGLFSFSTVPLTLVIWVGMILTAIGGMYLIYIILIYLMGISIQGWSSVVVSVLILGGVQLVSIGVVAQYVGMIFEQVKQRPIYTLKYGQMSQAVQGRLDRSEQ